MVDVWNKEKWKDYLHRYREIAQYSNKQKLTIDMINPKPKPKLNDHYRLNEYKGGIDVAYYNKIIRLHIENHRVIKKHPRSLEFYPTATQDTKIPKPNSKHLCRFARTPYHRTVNRRQISGSFIILNQNETQNLKPSESQKLQYFLKGVLKFKRTYQWKSVFYDKKHSPHPKKRIPLHVQLRQLPILPKLTCENVKVA